LQSGDLAGTRARLEAAAELAEASGDDIRRAQVLGNLVMVVGVGFEEPDAALAYAARARPIVERLQMPILAASLLRVEAQALLYKEDVAGARDRLERALAVWDRTLIGDHDATVGTLSLLGASVQKLGAWEVGDDYLRRAHEMSVRLHGEHHVTTASYLRDWAGCVLDQARAADAPGERERLGRLALDKADRAAADLEASLGVEHLESGDAQLIRCQVLWTLSELESAASACEQGLSVFRRVHGADSPLLVRPLSLLGAVQHARGELEPAHAALAEALTRSASGAPTARADVQFSLAKVLADLGQSRRALELARAARPALAADAKTSKSLAELDAWLAARRRPGRRAQPPTN
jgi:hypothetical protein